MGPVGELIREKRFHRAYNINRCRKEPTKRHQIVFFRLQSTKKHILVSSLAYNGTMLVRSSLEDLGLDHQRFSHKKDIKPWLLKQLESKKNIGISIERSDSIKVIFRCKPLLSREAETDPPRRHTTCPFKIRANYLIRNKTWSLVAINDSHNHELGEGPQGATETPEPGTFTFIGDSLGDTISVGEGMAMESSMVRNTGGVLEDLPANERRNSGVSSAFQGIINTNYSPEGLENDHEEAPVEETRISTKRPAKISFVVQKKPALGPSFSSPTSDMEQKDSILVIHGLHVRVRDEVRAIVERCIVQNTDICEEERLELLKGFVSQVLSDYKAVEDPEKTPKGLLGWMEPTPTGASLIPLSPLLNDSDTEAKLTRSGSSDHLPVDPPLMAPMLKRTPKSKSILNEDSYDHDNSERIGSLALSTSSGLLGFMVPLQKQSQLLPSFNMIQNQLPLSPNSFISTSNHIGPSAFITSSANTYSTTLNPSHLLKKSNRKSGLFSNTPGHQQTSGALFNLGEMKSTSSATSSGANGFLFPGHSSTGTATAGSTFNFLLTAGLGPTNGGISSPTSNTINGMGATNSSSGRDGISSMSGAISSNTAGGGSGANGLNSLILNDSGW